MSNYATRHDVISNNLANVSTNGYSRQDSLFERVANESESPLAAPIVHTRTDFTAGPPLVTGRALDLTLESAGFFTVQTERGERFTRLGSLSVDADGFLREAAGHLVLGTKGALFVGDDPVFVEPDGSVIVNGDVLDRLRLVTFAQAEDLVREDAGLYAMRPGTTPTLVLARPIVQEGQLEGSTVQPVSELVRMVAALRSYEAAAAAVRSTDRTVEAAVNEIAKV
jgi:flagellar basal-body rod protein FlgG